MDTNESRKLDVTILQAGTVDDDGISLSDLWVALRKGRVRLLAWLIVCAMLGGVIGAGYVLLSAKKLVTSIVQFSYDGVEEGLDPKGARLDVNKIKSPQIVEPMLEALGYTDVERVNAETVRQFITIEGQVPQDVVDRLTVITTIATNSSAVTNLEKVLDISYFPTQYMISLDAGELGLSIEAAQMLLDGVLENYRRYFYDTYADVQMMGVAVKGIDYLDYDYTEALDVLSSQITTMSSYVSGLEQRASDFRSVATGYTFADINASLEIVHSTDIALADALVFSYNLTKDRTLLATHLTYQVEENERQLGVAQRTLDTINAKLNAYQKDTVMMMGTDAQQNMQTGMSLTLASTEYDALIKQSIEASTKVARLQAVINKLKVRIEKAQDSDSVLTQAEYNRRCEEAEARLSTVSQKLAGWVSIIEQTAQEYFETEEFDDAFKVLLPAQDNGTDRNVRIIKYGLIGSAGGFGAVLLIYFTAVCFGLTAYGSNRREPKGANRKRLRAKSHVT